VSPLRLPALGLNSRFDTSQSDRPSAGGPPSSDCARISGRRRRSHLAPDIPGHVGDCIQPTPRPRVDAIPIRAKPDYKAVAGRSLGRVSRRRPSQGAFRAALTDVSSGKEPQAQVIEEGAAALTGTVAGSRLGPGRDRDVPQSRLVRRRARGRSSTSRRVGETSSRLSLRGSSVATLRTCLDWAAARRSGRSWARDPRPRPGASAQRHRGGSRPFCASPAV